MLQSAKLRERRRKCREALEGHKRGKTASSSPSTPEVENPREDNGGVSSAVEIRFQGGCCSTKASLCLVEPFFAVPPFRSSVKLKRGTYRLECLVAPLMQMVKVGTHLNKEFEKGSEIQITSLVLALFVQIVIFDERQRILNFQEGVRGRYSVAARDIAPGEILLVESEPAAWFLSWDKASTN